jgi:transcriptional regulator with XRE-family HTH domain|tara:strand:- start:1896 stop:2120 length:225 start_codon:yes stop_codon:yes gene_type:complete
MTFGKWLKLKLRNNKMTQAAFSNKINVSENTVNSWTANKRKPDTTHFIWICKILAAEENTAEHIIYYEASEYFL